MGRLHLGFRAAFAALGLDVVVPPPTSRRTLTLGARHSPESVCLPFKLTLGNMIEALDLGADTILMADGPGLCRFGYYARLQAQILRDLGYRFEMVNAELRKAEILGVTRLLRQLAPHASLRAILAAVTFGQAKIRAADEIERLVLKVRAREQDKGTATAIFREAVAAIDAAGDGKALAQTKAQHMARLQSVALDPDANPLRVGVMGELFVVLEPFASLDVEIELGKLGVEVQRSMFLSGAGGVSLFSGAVAFNTFGGSEEERLHRAARPYLRRDVAGDGWESVGEVAHHAGKLDGMVHLAPFTCMPEIVARNIIPSIGADLPVLTVICDEQMGEAGQVTRLEAFTDLLRRRQGRVRVELAASHR